MQITTTNTNEILTTDDPWDDILRAVMHGGCSTHHATLMATPGQLVFGHDMLFNSKFIADWRLMNQQKQAKIKKNNEKKTNSIRL